jgi:hypothetical protein
MRSWGLTVSTSPFAGPADPTDRGRMRAVRLAAASVGGVCCCLMNWLPSLRAILIFAGLLAIFAVAYWACNQSRNVRVSGSPATVLLLHAPVGLQF